MNSVSWALPTEVTCESCGAHDEAQIWVVISAADHPDLIDKAREGRYPGFACSRCGEYSPLDTPMLVHRPDQGGLAGLLFVPAYVATEQESTESAEGLVAVLLDHLGVDGADAAVPVFVVSRLNLPAVLHRDVREDLATPEHRLRLASNVSDGYRQLLAHLRQQLSN